MHDTLKSKGQFMAMSRAEINAKSDAKRGVRVQSYKLHEDIITLLAELSEATGKSKTAIVTEGILLFQKEMKGA